MNTSQQDLFVKTTLHFWETNINRASAIFDGCSDDDLMKEVAPGKNRVVYLLGHLTAVHDRMLPLLGLGERLFPHLDEPFVSNPDKIDSVLPPIKELRSCWQQVNDRVMESLRSLDAGEWLRKHTAVSDEDYVKEPHRNRLGVVLSRAGHISYHVGQLAWVKK
jgi:hypothetical protein